MSFYEVAYYANVIFGGFCLWLVVVLLWDLYKAPLKLLLRKVLYFFLK